MVAKSLPQLAYAGTTVLAHEEAVSSSQNIALYDLMKRAGEAVYSVIKHQYNPKSMLVFCGKGNNGGDGFIVARLALQQSLKVSVVLFSRLDQLTGDAKKACEAFIASGGEVEEVTLENTLEKFSEFSNYQVLVDAIFGIGFKGELPENIAQVVSNMNSCTTPIVSIDAPSGINTSTAEVASYAVKADVTVSLIALKRGLLTGKAKHFTGQLKFESLGLASQFCQRVESNHFVQIQQNLPNLTTRVMHQHKGNIGQLLTIGGQKGMPGSIRLASEAALRCGAPLVSVATDKENRDVVITNRYELMLAQSTAKELLESQTLEKAKAVVIGPGLGQSQWSIDFLELVLATPVKTVLDADALTLLAKRSNDSTLENHQWILTPHPKEAAILLNRTVDEVENNRFDAVRAIAQKYQSICILKGAGTLISNGQQTWINTTGNHGMATGGMGDVLSGVVGALALQTENLLDAARLAVYLHGKAGDNIATKQGHVGLLASDLFSEFPILLKNIYESI